MINSNKGYFCCHGQGLSEAIAHQKRTDQAGALGDSQAVNVLEFYRGFAKGVFNHRIYVLQMLARGNLGNDAAIPFVDIYLRIHHICQQYTVF